MVSRSHLTADNVTVADLPKTSALQDADEDADEYGDSALSYVD